MKKRRGRKRRRFGFRGEDEFNFEFSMLLRHPIQMPGR